MSKPRSKAKVSGSLIKKGFIVTRMKKHAHYVYYTLQGTATTINTHISHGSKKDLGSPLLSFMADQLKISNQQFIDFVDCPLSQQQYEKVLIDKQIL